MKPKSGISTHVDGSPEEIRTTADSLKHNPRLRLVLEFNHSADVLQNANQPSLEE